MIRLIKFSGCEMFINDSLEVHRYYLDHGLNYERHIRDELVKLVPKCSVMWDIGTNAGIHTVSAKQIKPDLTVVCVEPSGPNLDVLLKTIWHNGWKDVYVLPVALTDKSGLAALNGCPDNPLVGEHGRDYPLLVPCFKLDSFDLPAPQLVKIDIEGYELDVLSSSPKFMSHRPTFITEWNVDLLGRKGQRESYIDFFIQNNYLVTALDYKPNIRRQLADGKSGVAYLNKATGSNADLLCEPQ